MFIKVGSNLINMDGVKSVYIDDYHGLPCIAIYHSEDDIHRVSFKDEATRGRCWECVKLRLGLTGTNHHLKMDYKAMLQDDAIRMMEVDPGKRYICVVDDRVNLDDLTARMETGHNIKIVRVKR